MCDYSSVVYNEGKIRATAKIIRNYMQKTKSSCEKAMDFMGVDSDIRAEVAKMVSEGKDC